MYAGVQLLALVILAIFSSSICADGLHCRYGYSLSLYERGDYNTLRSSLFDDADYQLHSSSLTEHGLSLPVQQIHARNLARQQATSRGRSLDRREGSGDQRFYQLLLTDISTRRRMKRSGPGYHSGSSSPHYSASSSSSDNGNSIYVEFSENAQWFVVLYAACYIFGRLGIAGWLLLGLLARLLEQCGVPTKYLEVFRHGLRWFSNMLLGNANTAGLSDQPDTNPTAFDIHTLTETMEEFSTNVENLTEQIKALHDIIAALREDALQKNQEGVNTFEWQARKKGDKGKRRRKAVKLKRRSKNEGKGEIQAKGNGKGKKSSNVGQSGYKSGAEQGGSSSNVEQGRVNLDPEPSGSKPDLGKDQEKDLEKGPHTGDENSSKRRKRRTEFWSRSAPVVKTTTPLKTADIEGEILGMQLVGNDGNVLNSAICSNKFICCFDQDGKGVVCQHIDQAKRLHPKLAEILPVLEKHLPELAREPIPPELKSTPQQQQQQHVSPQPITSTPQQQQQHQQRVSPQIVKPQLLKQGATGNTGFAVSPGAIMKI